MSVTRRPVIKILLIDYDNCAAVVTSFENNTYKFNASNKFLEPRLLNIAKKGNYHGFVGVTHRCCHSFEPWPEGRDFAKDILTMISLASRGQDFKLEDYLSGEVTKNFETVTKVPNLAVSTPDDCSETAPKVNPCGYGFTYLLNPYEKQLVADYKKFETFYSRDSDQHIHLDKESFENIAINKNIQLVQTIRFVKQLIKKQYPNLDPILEFHFFDDVENYCKQAKDIKPQLPPDVIFKSYRHDTMRRVFADMSKPIVVFSTIKHTPIKNVKPEKSTLTTQTSKLFATFANKETPLSEAVPFLNITERNLKP